VWVARKKAIFSPKIGENRRKFRRKSQKMGENRRKWAKIAENGLKSQKIVTITLTYTSKIISPA
jgi:hypothetical protein